MTIPFNNLDQSPFWRTWATRVIIMLLLAVAVIYAAKLGLQFRRWMWETTTPIRFNGDIDRGFFWGREAAAEGFANQYEKMQPEQPHDLNWLDYAPLRLGVMTLWAKWAAVHYPHVQKWHENRSFDFTAPVLWFNTFMEAVGAVSAFFLTRLWAIRGRRSAIAIHHSRFFDGWIPGLIAAALLWFNPAIVLSGYGWPTWDLWIVPMFLLAALLASLDWWFTAGVVLGIGAMFKGQQLISIPVFFAWAILIGRPVWAMRMLAGATIAIAVVASPWLLTYIPTDKLATARSIQSERQPALVADGTFAIPRVVNIWAIVWVTGVLMVTIAAPFVARVRLATAPQSSTEPTTISVWRHFVFSQWTFPAIAVLGTFLIVAWPWMLRSNRPHWIIGELAGIALAAATRWLRPRGIVFVAAGAVGAAMLLCMSAFHGSSAWYDCGIHFGTVHWPTMAVGYADNLPAILRDHYHWSDDLQATAVTLPAHSLFSLWSKAPVDVSGGVFLRGLFFILLGLSSIGVGLQARRRDPRLLIGIVAPWLMFFCFAPQVHERYLLFAAGISCVCAGISTGMMLLGMLLSVVAGLMTLHTMLASTSAANRQLLGLSLAQQFPSVFDHRAGNVLLSIAEGTHPDLGFAVVLIGLVFLYFTLALRKSYGDVHLIGSARRDNL